MKVKGGNAKVTRFLAMQWVKESDPEQPEVELFAASGNHTLACDIKLVMVKAELYCVSKKLCILKKDLNFKHCFVRGFRDISK